MMISVHGIMKQERKIGSARVEFTVLNRMARKVLAEKIVFEPRLEGGDKGMSMEIIEETAFQVEESANIKTLHWYQV